ncbi:hypothetical protein FHW96_000557 [Novosphingobium sp. SG751A]|uniref:bifunctional aminoglycoside phosphotransferase/ATP-binding protein n=1 Tax=Novosphingobium sp. SG751A TaxID=2587000 RepID=UPI001557E527|nr:bifunctional aminoglycoside phosphotransferase/ATP-binding protein [Novosphingobium sp. SG751A]NOW44415.1 hypothetical protein [Novosphingobium sp. SG751A]
MAMDHSEQDQSVTIAFLSAPGVERIDTHGAMIFLGPDTVYKLKRAVDLGYLDFSTLALREAACRAELVLNRRTAPDLYCGLRAIRRGADGAPGWDGAGEVIDWVVVMRRFPAQDLLTQVAARGALTQPMLHALADGVADFHGKAQILPDADGAARMREVIIGNARSFAAIAPDLLPAGKVADLQARSLEALAQVADLLDVRARAGKVRHGHGDLHLANICLWQGRPVPFDCLEFSAELATTDLLYDLAFLLMDLWHKGYAQAANLIANRYADRMGEEDGWPALPLFLSVRAAIRAHVGAATAVRLSGAARADKAGEALAYLDAALKFLRPGAVGLIAVGGLSGTGKSTLAGALAHRIGAAPGARWLRSDVIRKSLAGVAPEDRLPGETYTREASALVYAAMVDRAGAMLCRGWPVVADAVFAAPDERAAIAQAARAADAPFLGLWLTADGATMQQRVTARRGDASDADAAVVARQMAYNCGDLSDWRVLAADGSRDAVVAAALDAAQGLFILQKS